MGQQKKVAFAAFAVFLLLSGTPIDASRIQGHQQAQGGALALIKVNSYQPAEGTCEQLETQFNQRVAELTERQAQQHESPTFRGGLALAMKLRAMNRIMRRGAQADCEWVMGTGFDTSAMDESARQGLAGHPCSGQIQEMMASHNQTETGMAMQMILSGSCEPEPIPDQVDVDEGTVDLETDALEDEAEQIEEEALTGDGSSLMQAMTAAQQDPLSAVLSLVLFLFILALSCFMTLLGILLSLMVQICLILFIMGTVMGRFELGGRCLDRFLGWMAGSVNFCSLGRVDVNQR